MLYVGDHEKDEAAARDIGASFIHARLIASLKASADKRTLSFEDYSKLIHAIELAESRVRASEDVPHAGRHY